jgi:hypothetical protein
MPLGGKEREHEQIQAICFAAPVVRFVFVFDLEGRSRSQVGEPGFSEPGFREP